LTVLVVDSFVHLFVHSLIESFIGFVDWWFQWLIHLFIHSLKIHSLDWLIDCSSGKIICSFIHSRFIHWIDWLFQWLIHLFIHSLTDSFIGLVDLDWLVSVVVSLISYFPNSLIYSLHWLIDCSSGLFICSFVCSFSYWIIHWIWSLTVPVVDSLVGSFIHSLVGWL